MAAITLLGLLGVVLIAVGVWGGRSAASLPPSAMSAEERHRREYVLRRGAFSCQIMGVLCVVAAVILGLR